jgi:hypothetical protein
MCVSVHQLRNEPRPSLPGHVRSMRLGDSSIAATFWARRKVPPSGEHKQAKDRVDKAEHPGRRAVVQELLQPVLNEPTTVCLCAGLRAQPHFKCRERARDTKPCFCHNSGNGNEMRQPEPEAIDPAPALEISKDSKNQASHDKSRNGDVQDQHGVGEKLALRFVEQHSCLNRDRKEPHGPCLPHHRTYGSRIRRFGGLSRSVSRTVRLQQTGRWMLGSLLQASSGSDAMPSVFAKPSCPSFVPGCGTVRAFGRLCGW